MFLLQPPLSYEPYFLVAHPAVTHEDATLAARSRPFLIYGVKCVFLNTENSSYVAISRNTNTANKYFENLTKPKYLKIKVSYMDKIIANQIQAVAGSIQSRIFCLVFWCLKRKD